MNKGKAHSKAPYAAGRGEQRRKREHSAHAQWPVTSYWFLVGLTKRISNIKKEKAWKKNEVVADSL